MYNQTSRVLLQLDIASVSNSTLLRATNIVVIEIREPWRAISRSTELLTQYPNAVEEFIIPMEL